jgi:hypothetical protein
MSSDANVSSGSDANDGTKGKPPVEKKSYGALTVSIWEHETTDGARLFHNYTIQRSFQDERGDWFNSSTFRAMDSMDHLMCVFWAHRWIRSEGKQCARGFAQQTGASQTASEDDVPF